MKLPKKSKFFRNLPQKSNFVCEIAWKNRNISEICLEKSIFLPGSTTHQISNQIDAAELMYIYSVSTLYSSTRMFYANIII